jgi:hypothetical protein
MTEQALDPLVMLIFGQCGFDEGYVIDHAKFWETTQRLVWKHERASVYRVLSVRYHRDGRERNSTDEAAVLLGMPRAMVYRLTRDALRMLQRRDVWQQYAAIKEDQGDE